MGQWLGGGWGWAGLLYPGLIIYPQNPAQALMLPPDPALPPHVCVLPPRRLHFNNADMSKGHSSPSPAPLPEREVGAGVE